MWKYLIYKRICHLLITVAPFLDVWQVYHKDLLLINWTSNFLMCYKSAFHLFALPLRSLIWLSGDLSWKQFDFRHPVLKKPKSLSHSLNRFHLVTQIVLHLNSWTQKSVFWPPIHAFSLARKIFHNSSTAGRGDVLPSWHYTNSLEGGKEIFINTMWLDTINAVYHVP